MMEQNREGGGEFILRIDITGLCLYVWDADRKSVDLYMPDATATGGVSNHPDGEPTVPHAGYLRFDLKNLDTRVSFEEGELPDILPSYEVVHRFQHEELFLNLPGGEEIVGTVLLPDVAEFAPVLQPKRTLDDSPPPPEVLMRTRLVGGELTSPMKFREPLRWKIRGDLRPDKTDTIHILSGSAVWERRLKGDGLELVLSRFDRTGRVTIPLHARRAEGDVIPEIRLHLANLCENPLQWPELDVPTEPVADLDFKWLYQLLELRPEHSPQEYSKQLCPVPEPIGGGKEGDLQNCFGAQATRP